MWEASCSGWCPTIGVCRCAPHLVFGGACSYSEDRLILVVYMEGWMEMCFLRLFLLRFWFFAGVL